MACDANPPLCLGLAPSWLTLAFLWRPGLEPVLQPLCYAGPAVQVLLQFRWDLPALPRTGCFQGTLGLSQVELSFLSGGRAPVFLGSQDNPLLDSYQRGGLLRLPLRPS